MKTQKYFLLIAVLIIFTLMNCTVSRQEKSDLEELSVVIVEFRVDVNDVNIDKILERYADEAIILPDREEMVIGKQAIIEFWNRHPYTRIELVENQVALNGSGSSAYEVNTSTFKYQLEGQ